MVCERGEEIRKKKAGPEGEREKVATLFILLSLFCYLLPVAVAFCFLLCFQEIDREGGERNILYKKTEGSSSRNRGQVLLMFYSFQNAIPRECRLHSSCFLVVLLTLVVVVFLLLL